METKIENREAWLTEFAKRAMPLIKQRTNLAQEGRIIQLSCGFPLSGARISKKGKVTTGQCFHTHGTERKRFQIFIHPMRDDPFDIGETVLHELLHALLPGGVGHRAPFARACKQLGLEGKPTETKLSDELRERVKEIVEELGPYPHERLEAFGRVQGTRLLKIMCPVCGYVLRVTRTWLDEAGAPLCAQCSCEFQEADAGDEATDPLFAVDQVVEYKVKAQDRKKGQPMFDPRWSVWMQRKSGKVSWHVLDYGPPVDPTTGMAVLGIVQPRRTPAESREDAIGLLEALREGNLTYEDIEVRDEDVEDPDYDEDDPRWAELDDEEDEDQDYEDPLILFEHEQDAPDYDEVARQREANAA